MNATVKMSLNRLKSGAITSLVVALTIGLAGCEYSKNIQEFPEPWQVLDSGKPLEKFPKIQILEQGGGAIIESGDLVELGVRAVKLPEDTYGERGNWWLWIGFRTAKETAFFSIGPGIASSLTGLHQGTAFRFVDIQGIPDVVGQLWPNAMGSHEYYGWRKNTTENAYVYGTTNTGYTRIEIKRVCKGPLQYRTVRLFDDGPVKVCPGLNCYTSDKPREAWIDEARIEAKCNDGKVATFQYGPTGSYSGRSGRSPVMGYFDDWLRDAWQKVPLGVQLE